MTLVFCLFKCAYDMNLFFYLGYNDTVHAVVKDILNSGRRCFDGSYHDKEEINELVIYKKESEQCIWTRRLKCIACEVTMKK